MARKTKGKTVEPIPEDQIKEWKALISKTEKLVQTSDNATYGLILLAGEVVTKYGENRVQRWAEESGLTFSQAKQYKWLAHKGFDQEFIDTWCKTSKRKDGLNYSVIREIASFCGSLSSPYAVEKLTWAMEHKASVAAIRGYMYELMAPMNEKDEAAASIKVALADKQEHEGFSDYMRSALEKIVEENPAAEAQVLKTVITNEEDYKKLQVQAGIIPDDDGDAERFAKQYISKLKRINNQIKEASVQMIAHIEEGHVTSEELLTYVRACKHTLDEIAKAELPDLSNLEEHVSAS